MPFKQYTSWTNMLDDNLGTLSTFLRKQTPAFSDFITETSHYHDKICQTIAIFHHPSEVFGDAFCGGWIFSPCAIPPKEIAPRGYLCERHQHQWFPLPGRVPPKNRWTYVRAACEKWWSLQVLRICETIDKTVEKKGLLRLERPEVLRWKMMENFLVLLSGTKLKERTMINGMRKNDD